MLNVAQRMPAVRMRTELLDKGNSDLARYSECISRAYESMVATEGSPMAKVILIDQGVSAMCYY